MKRNHNPSSDSLAQTSGTAEVVDALISNVLENIRLQGAVFFAWQPSWPFATGVPSECHFRDLILPSSDQVISYHIVVEGPCWATVEGEKPVRLEGGDILLVPHGDAYAISDQPRGPSDQDIEPAQQFFAMMAAGELPLVIQDGGGGPGQSQLVCGFLGCDRHPWNPLLEGLPRFIVLSRSALHGPINDLIDIVLRECGHPGAGSRSMMRRLGELLFIEVIRQFLQHQGLANNPWMRGLADPLVGKSLSLLHGRIAETWTLEKLASEVNCSRSVLAERFSRVIGVPPMKYLSQWRLQVAARLLRGRQDKILSIALSVGYESETSFSRAFKRSLGTSPSAFRRSVTSDGGHLAENINFNE
ncbi:AraC family transcriptional regulator [Marinobacter sp. BW6]|uniref:AraC family transcriptional regulator n=1 Tax=Marinobacter sp. BW6 TaxID=2592624 RepID=UPI001396BC0A|nr:AraC family transcriptional regulator [Marinobacter sp. BW6]